VIIIDEYKCGYQHVPKSGSTSVCHYFADLLDVQPIKWHDSGGSTLRNEWEKRSGIIPKDYYIFSFVRNPWSRLVSGYYEFLKYLESTNAGYPGAVRQNKKWANEKRLTIPQMTELISSREDPPTFDAFADFVINIEEQHAKTNCHWMSQCRLIRLFELEDKKRKTRISDYDFIGRLETFEKDLKHVAGIIGAPIDEVPWEQKQLAKSGKTYKDFYTNQKLIDDVGKHYEEDIDRFKYAF